MRSLLLLMLSVILLGAVACNTAKDTANTADKGGQDAVGVAEQMKGGTVGSVDEDTGESSSGESGE